MERRIKRSIWLRVVLLIMQKEEKLKKAKTKFGTPVVLLKEIGGDCYLVEVEGKNSNGITMIAKNDLEIEEKD